MIIAGIGSRTTPDSVCAEMESIGAWIRNNKGIVRSGHAEGADYAFEKGAQKSCHVYLPWYGFNSKYSLIGTPIYPELTEELKKFVFDFHPAPHRLKVGAVKLHARNACQILGSNLDLPCDAVVCWSKGTGGTQQALRIAKHYKIPIYNMHDSDCDSYDKVIEKLKDLSIKLVK